MNLLRQQRLKSKSIYYFDKEKYDKGIYMQVIQNGLKLISFSESLRHLF